MDLTNFESVMFALVGGIATLVVLITISAIINSVINHIRNLK